MYMTKVYYNNWLAKLILFKGYSTITLGPFILTKEDYLPDHVINEERIHVRQWKDCFTMGLIIAYFASFLFSAPLPLVRILAIPVAFRAVLHHVPGGVVNIFHVPRCKRQGERGWRVQQQGLLRFCDGDGS